MTKAHFRVLATAAYVVVMAAVVFGPVRRGTGRCRLSVITAAQTQWNTFREDVVQQTQQGASVQRRVPKSVEPPGLVLMRDYFACLHDDCRGADQRPVCHDRLLCGGRLGPAPITVDSPPGTAAGGTEGVTAATRALRPPRFVGMASLPAFSSFRPDTVLDGGHPFLVDSRIRLSGGVSYREGRHCDHHPPFRSDARPRSTMSLSASKSSGCVRT